MLAAKPEPAAAAGVVFDRTPLDYLAYMAATGADPCDEADAAMLRPALDLVYDDPLNARADIPVLELSGPLDGRLNAVLAALNRPGTLTHRDQTPGSSPIAPLAPLQRASGTGIRGTECLRTPL